MVRPQSPGAASAAWLAAWAAFAFGSRPWAEARESIDAH